MVSQNVTQHHTCVYVRVYVCAVTRCPPMAVDPVMGRMGAVVVVVAVVARCLPFQDLLLRKAFPLSMPAR